MNIKRWKNQYNFEYINKIGKPLARHKLSLSETKRGHCCKSSRHCKNNKYYEQLCGNKYDN